MKVLVDLCIVPICVGLRRTNVYEQFKAMPKEQGTRKSDGSA
jgi:hypothetical protein